MGARGPVPKRSDTRRRKNKTKCPECGEMYVPGSGMSNHRRSAHGVASGNASNDSSAPPADSSWHRVALQWYESLALSGQSMFYEASDWSTAYLLAESISRELAPRPVFNDKGEEVAVMTMPVKGAALSAWLKGMSSLLVTEGDRRRVQLELQRPNPEGESSPAPVTDMRAWREGLNA